jgi:ABC-type glycerol-3-phosphate transport system substrate-binding protein
MKRPLVTLIVVVALIAFCASLSFGAGQAAKSTGKRTINFFTYDAINFRPKLEEFFAEFEELNPNVTINADYTPVPVEQFRTLVSAGNQPHIMFSNSSWILDFIKAGKMTELPADYYNKIKKELYPQTFTPSMSKGKVYGIPFNFTPMFSVLMTNAELWKNAGIDPGAADYWDDYMKMAQKLTKRDASGKLTQVGFSAKRRPEVFFISYLLQSGGKPFNKDGSAAFDSALGREALQRYVDVYKKWKVDDLEFGRAEDEFRFGHIASIFMGPWYGSILAKENPELNIGYALQPAFKDKKATRYWPLVEVWTHYVNKEALNMPEVWSLFDYLLKPENAAEWAAFAGEFSTVAAASKYPGITGTPYLAPFVPIADLGVADDITDWMTEDVIQALVDMCYSVVYDKATVDQAITNGALEVNRLTKKLQR